MSDHRQHDLPLCRACFALFGNGKFIPWLTSDASHFDPRYRAELADWILTATAHDLDTLQVDGVLVEKEGLIIRRNLEYMQLNSHSCAVCSWLMIDFMYRTIYLQGEEIFIRFEVEHDPSVEQHSSVELADHRPLMIKLQHVIPHSKSEWETTTFVNRHIAVYAYPGLRVNCLTPAVG